MRVVRGGRLLLAALVVFAAGLPGPAHARTSDEERYIVVYEDSVRAPGAATQRREHVQRFRADHRFGQVVKGFSAKLSRGQVTRLRHDRAVAAVVPDRRLRATQTTSLRAGEAVPTGARRIGVATATAVREASGARVAVLDTGIDLRHPDLNATAGVDCIAGRRGKRTQKDASGHGTHVAGIIGARNDGRGVVGVAPGTEVVSVKVLGRRGGGWTSDLICGIDWVTATRTDDDPHNDIAVANLSLGARARPIGACPARRDPLHAAICRSSAAGVTYVAAAGNGARAFDHARRPVVPAAYPEVLTVTAMSDTDGEPGRRGPRGCSGEDVAAPFSNFATTTAGRAHTIAAPGSCILSTTPGGRIGRRGGTSVAAPHIAGLVALCHDEGGRAGVCADRPAAENVKRMVDRARVRAFEAPGFGFAGDPREGVRRSLAVFFGHLAWGGADMRAPVVTITTPGEGSRVASDALVLSGTAGTASGDADEVVVELFHDSAVGRRVTAPAGAGAWSIDLDAPLRPGRYALRVSQRDGAGNVGVSALRSFSVGTRPRSWLIGSREHSR
ncbi:MAG TPA: S8 family serine peptidase [Solirubrobacteraceae bacterium]|nr:S8 family serine peptidase [Solirubrobacteraceae bacterium]